MGLKTNIEWCDSTYNHWIGCTKVSDGCSNCYAAALDARLKFTPEGWGQGKPRALQSDAYRNKPFAWNNQAFRANKARSVFPSLMDWLDEEIPIAWLVDFLDTVSLTQHLRWLLLTKRPENFRSRMERAMQLAVQSDLTKPVSAWLCTWLAHSTPPHNVWIGVSVEDQSTADERIPRLLEIPAAGRFISAEPLLGEIRLDTHVKAGGPMHCEWCGGFIGGQSSHDCYNPRLGIDWVIAGGESGSKARPSHVDWFRSLRDQCAESRIPFFFKQWGEWLPHDQTAVDEAAPLNLTQFGLNGRVRRYNWSDGYAAFQVGKKLPATSSTACATEFSRGKEAKNARFNNPTTLGLGDSPRREGY